MQPTANRVQSIDILRGAVMILMAIDHVRVYSGMPAGGPDPGIFFTRWITHFCVPVFVFFAGTGSFMYAQKLGNKRSLARYLFTRGILLVLLELTLVRFSWTFSMDYSQFVLAGVIWMLGWCMILFSIFVRLSTLAIGITGLAISFLQQVFQYFPKIFPGSMRDSVASVWSFIYPCGSEGIPVISILYHIVPWIGIMMAGYAFGTILLKETAVRKKICLLIGVSATVIFVIIACINVFSHTAPADAPPALFRILNQQKYPASQLYLLMTLGPVILLLPFAERARGWFANVLGTFGRVQCFIILCIFRLFMLQRCFLIGCGTEIFTRNGISLHPIPKCPENINGDWDGFTLYL
jgi:uncharacterized membrane protein